MALHMHLVKGLNSLFVMIKCGYNFQPHSEMTNDDESRNEKASVLSIVGLGVCFGSQPQAKTIKTRSNLLWNGNKSCVSSLNIRRLNPPHKYRRRSKYKSKNDSIFEILSPRGEFTSWPKYYKIRLRLW